MQIWSKRYSHAKGNYWKAERYVSNEVDIPAWLEVFRNDEPDIIFIASSTRPAMSEEYADLLAELRVTKRVPRR